jgi:cation transport ATPase
MLLAYH